VLRPRFLVPAAIALGLAAQIASATGLDPWLVVADLAVGWLFIGAGALARARRPGSLIGVLMIATGVTWFAGDLVPAALFLHRGPLFQLLATFPTGRLAGRTQRVVVAAVYVVSAIAPLAQSEVLTVLLGGALVGTGILVMLGTNRTMRRARRSSGLAAVALGLILVAGSLGRLMGSEIDVPILAAYLVVLATVPVALVADMLWGGWSEGLVARVVVDLGDAAQAGSVRDRLARAVGDPSLIVGYAIEDGSDRYVDEAGAPVALPSEGSGLVVTPMNVSGKTTGIIIHDPSVLGDPQMVDTIAAAASVAMANSAMQAQIHAMVADVDASRTRLVHAADTQRLRIERSLHAGAMRRLEHIGDLLVEAQSHRSGDDGITALLDELEAARAEVNDFARGVHPASLATDGLQGAIRDLANRASIPVEVNVDSARSDASIESTLYFVASEALANVAKHASARTIRVELHSDDTRQILVVDDDGVGGANALEGGGLAGLVDRVEALGGWLTVESHPGQGTRVVANMPRRAAPTLGAAA
jgi:signal transduction histidine kinase